MIVRRAVFFPLVCCLSVLLAGCLGKMVSVMDEDGFRSLAQRFGPELRSRQIVDSEGSWLEPLPFLSDTPADAGERLFLRLSPAFRFRGTDSALVPATFAASRIEGDGLTISPCGFTLVQGMRQVDVSLLALTDWNGDGTDDWLVRCAVRDAQIPSGEEERDYYLAVENPEAAIMEPRVIGVYICRNRRCVAHSGARDVPPEVSVVDLLPGQRTVTAPPGGSGKMKKSDSLHEQKLKN